MASPFRALAFSLLVWPGPVGAQRMQRGAKRFWKSPATDTAINHRRFSALCLVPFHTLAFLLLLWRALVRRPRMAGRRVDLQISTIADTNKHGRLFTFFFCCWYPFVFMRSCCGCGFLLSGGRRGCRGAERFCRYQPLPLEVIMVALVFGFHPYLVCLLLLWLAPVGAPRMQRTRALMQLIYHNLYK